MFLFFKQERLIFSRFWKLDIQGIRRLNFSWGLSLLLVDDCLLTVASGDLFSECTRVMLSEVIHAVSAYVSLYCQTVFHCMTVLPCVYPFIIGGHLGCFHFLAIMSNIVMDKALYGHMYLVLLGRQLKAEVLGHMFNQLRNCHPLFQSDCPMLQFYQESMRAPISPNPHEHLLLSVFFI